VEGRDDGEIVTHMDDAAREGDALGLVFGRAGDYLCGEIFEANGLGDAAGFVETVHVGVEGEERNVR